MPLGSNGMVSPATHRFGSFRDQEPVTPGAEWALPQDYALRLSRLNFKHTTTERVSFKLAAQLD
jgi:hypothetical protein